MHRSYFIDTTQALLLAHRYDDLLHFAGGEDTCNADDGLEHAASEARLIAAAQLGDYDSAWQEAHPARNSSEIWSLLVSRLRLAELAIAMGNRANAVAALSSIVGVSEKLALTARPRLGHLLWLQRVAVLLVGLEKFERAFEVGQVALAASRRVGDEIVLTEMLDLLAAVAPSARGRAQFTQDAALARHQTLYSRLRSSDSKGGDAIELFAGLETDFRATLER